MDFNQHITKNFTWNEFFRSDTATRLNIDNTTTDSIILSNIKELTANILQPLRDKFGRIRITSGYRCLMLNRKIKSGDYSNHVYGLAVDIESENVSLINLITYIHKNFEYKELIAEYFPHGWVHIAYQHDNNKRVLKLKDKDHHFKRVTLDYVQGIYG